MSKSILSVLVISSFLFASFSSAQTTTPDFQAIIKQLQDQIKFLNQQITDLQSRLKKTEEEVEVVKAELKITRFLRKGESGDEVRQLQEFLKQFPDIYPEGVVTGFFGSLTELAVKRFQEKHGIESIGIVGPKTLQKLNEFSVSASPAVPATPATPAVPAIPASPSLPLQPASPSQPIISPTIPAVPGVSSATPAIPATPVQPSSSTSTSTPTPLVTATPSVTASPSYSPTPTPAPNTVVTITRLFPGQYNNTKYQFTVSDSDGIKGFDFRCNTSCANYSQPGFVGGGGTCPLYKQITTETVTLNSSDFPVGGYVTDCSGRDSYIVNVSMPPLPASTPTPTPTPAPTSDSFGPNITSLSISPTSAVADTEITFTATAEDVNGISIITYDIRYPDNTYVLKLNCGFFGAKSGPCPISQKVDRGYSPPLSGSYVIETIKIFDSLNNLSIYYPNGTVTNRPQSTHNLTIPVITFAASTPIPTPTPAPTGSVSFSPDSFQISAMANILNALKSILGTLSNLIPR